MLDKEKARKNLKEILDKMQKGSNAVLLHEYYKLFKKEIPFFRRSLTAAWLFMNYDRKDEKSGDKNNFAVLLSEDESKQLFISIGKNRRLFPKEIITLIMAKTSTAREDIGIIKIFDNFSFVQVRDTKAAEIIETLTGHRFRGRTLVLNYAKPKNEMDESEK